jgi:hypothetical protein
VVRHRAAYEPGSYRKVSVDVKETNDVGWLRVPGHTLPDVHAANGVAVVAEGVIELPLRASVVLPSTPEFYEVVTALEDIECMRGEHTRSLVIDQLRFAGVIRYFASRRQHIISILRTCCDFEDGVIELVRAITEHEPSDSKSLRRLLQLLTGSATAT